MSTFEECSNCQSTGSVYIGPGSHLDEESYDTCLLCHGRGGYYEDEDENEKD